MAIRGSEKERMQQTTHDLHYESLARVIAISASTKFSHLGCAGLPTDLPIVNSSQLPSTVFLIVHSLSQAFIDMPKDIYMFAEIFLKT